MSGTHERLPLTVDELWAVRRVGAPSLAPDGRRAVIDVSAYDLEENSKTSQLWLLDAEGGEPAQLTTHSAGASAPRWSPDGSRITFLSRREEDAATQLYLIAPDGGEARRLTQLATGASSHKWSADGRQLAFVSWVWPDLATDAEQAARLNERAEAKVRVVAVETTSFRYWDHWLADGRVPHLFLVDVATGECRDLLAGTGLHLFPYHESLDLPAGLYDLSPDGQEVALTVELGDDPGFDPAPDIVLLSLATAGWRNMTAENPASDRCPRYSPDGRQIAFLRQSIPYFYADRQRIALYDRETGATRVLTEAWDRSADPPLWSPDGTRLFFTAEDRARQPVWELAVASGEPRTLIESGVNSHLDLSAGGNALAFVRTTMDAPPRIFVAGADGSAPRPVEKFNAERTAAWELGEVREDTIAGWSGQPVQFWTIFPPRFEADKKWPLLQIVHGGPHGAWRDEFHFRWNMHAFAARGYVVAAVNFHGSTGWGQAFTDANTGDYGAKELADVEAATDHLLAAGFIDAERLAAAGGSFGGYMVAWMNGHTDRYRAYVCHAGVYDWVAQMASDSTRGRERALGAFPWEDPERVLRQSAHSYAKAFATPTLVLHGELDYRVPVTQGFEYYSTLRMRGVPARLVYFPDENHWVLKPQNSRRWYEEFFAWIERHVPPGSR